MWEKIYEFARQLLALRSQVEQNTQDIKELRRDFKELTAIVQKLANTVERSKENEAYEREKLVLQLKIALQDFDRKLLESENRYLRGAKEPDQGN
jgi:chromosome segregation ATPase